MPVSVAATPSMALNFRRSFVALAGRAVLTAVTASPTAAERVPRPPCTTTRNIALGCAAAASSRLCGTTGLLVRRLRRPRPSRRAGRHGHHQRQRERACERDCPRQPPLRPLLDPDRSAPGRGARHRLLGHVTTPSCAAGAFPRDRSKESQRLTESAAQVHRTGESAAPHPPLGAWRPPSCEEESAFAGLHVAISESARFACLRGAATPAGGRARSASARRAWRRRGSGDSPPCAPRGRAPRRPRRSSVPFATSAATRRSAGVRPSMRVRPPIRPSSSRARSAQRAAPSSSKPAHAASIASRAGRFWRARRRATPSASSARARPKGSPTASCCATASLEHEQRPARCRLARRRRARGSVSRARAPSRGRAGERPPPTRRDGRPRPRPDRARAAPRPAPRATSTCSARPRRRAGRPSAPRPRSARPPPRGLRSRSSTTASIAVGAQSREPCELGEPAASALRARGRARGRRGERPTSADGKQARGRLRLVARVLDGSASSPRSAYSPASANGPREARRARGTRARTRPCARRTRSSPGRGLRAARAPARGGTTRPDVCEREARLGRRLRSGGARRELVRLLGEPQRTRLARVEANDREPGQRRGRGARRPRACSASSTDARACRSAAASPSREADEQAQPLVDRRLQRRQRSPPRAAPRAAAGSRVAGPPTRPRPARTSASARSAPAGARATRSLGQHPRSLDLARREMRARGRQARRSASARSPAGVRRSACSPSSAAAIGAPWAAAAAAACSSAAASSASGRSVESARWRARATGSSASSREAAVRALPLVRRQPLVEDRGEQRMREANRAVARARSRSPRAPDRARSARCPGCRARTPSAAHARTRARALRASRR